MFKLCLTTNYKDTALVKN